MLGPVEVVITRTRCCVCGEPFSDANVYSEAGWLETQISSMCEVCFDTVADLIAKESNDEQSDNEH